MAIVHAQTSQLSSATGREIFPSTDIPKKILPKILEYTAKRKFIHTAAFHQDFFQFSQNS